MSAAPERKADAPEQATTNPADPTRAAKLAQAIVAILVDEDSITRQRSVQAAMMLLGEGVPHQPAGQPHPRESDSSGDSHAELATFFNREGDLKPADHAHLCVAYHYSIYGACAFSIAELKAIAADVGVVLPDRVDKTLQAAAHKGKKLFQSSGSGVFKPTAAAGLYFGEKWKVKPGRLTKSAMTSDTTDAKA